MPTIKTFNVYMTAFMSKNDIRSVDVFEEELNGDPKNDLERIFHYGQNDFQAEPHPSVSVGDVIDYNGKLYMVKPTGFTELSREEFDAIDKQPGMSAYMDDKLSKSLDKLMKNGGRK